MEAGCAASRARAQSGLFISSASVTHMIRKTLCWTFVARWFVGTSSRCIARTRDGNPIPLASESMGRTSLDDTRWCG